MNSTENYMLMQISSNYYPKAVEVKESKPLAKRQEDHRTSCHRCGNIRKKKLCCEECPMVYCAKCCEKMKDEHGEDVFTRGCPMV